MLQLSGSKSSAAEFSVLCHPFHSGAITGIDVCHRKPIVVSCGADRTIRIWNYLTLQQELAKEFDESVNCVALHPTGLNVLAGMKNQRA